MAASSPDEESSYLGPSSDQESRTIYGTLAVRSTTDSSHSNCLVSSHNSHSIQNSRETIRSDTQIKVYKRRWYLLFVFCLMGVLQGLIWNTWGPIENSAKLVYGWHDKELSMMVNVGDLFYIVTMVPASWIMDVKGLRIASLSCTALLILSCGLRVLPLDPLSDLHTWLVYLAQALNGIAGTIPFGGPSAFSMVWFPHNQRATSTAIVSAGCALGSALGFLIGPLVVPDISNNSSVIIHHNHSASTFPPIANNSNATEQQNGILYYLYGQLVFAGLLFFLTLIYFPANPPSPPSLSAKEGHEHFLEGIKDLCRLKSFWLIALAYGIGAGVFGIWTGVMAIDLVPEGVSQIDSGWLGFYATIVGSAIGILVSRFADIFSGHFKLMIIVMTSLSVVSMAVFTAMSIKLIPFSMALLYTTIISLYTFAYCSYPLIFELSCEIVYPVGEGVTVGVLTLLNNLFGSTFAFIFWIPNIGTSWMNWTVLGSLAFALPCFLLLKDKYNRSMVDTNLNNFNKKEITLVS